MNAIFNQNGVVLQIDGLRVPEVTRCHVTLRQLDSRESPAVSKYMIVDVSSDSALQSLLKQVCARSLDVTTTAFTLTQRLAISCLQAPWVCADTFMIILVFRDIGKILLAFGKLIRRTRSSNLDHQELLHTVRKYIVFVTSVTSLFCSFKTSA
jgi:hypothetical protein